MRPERLLEALARARAAAAARSPNDVRATPSALRRALALARARPELVLAAGLLAGVALMVAHWL